MGNGIAIMPVINRDETSETNIPKIEKAGTQTPILKLDHQAGSVGNVSLIHICDHYK